MNKTQEALKLALEALENTSPLGFNMESDKRFYAAITAIHEALAEQPAQPQEPVAWWRLAEDDGHQKYPVVSVEKPHPQWTTTRPLVFGDTSPPASKPLTDEQISNALDEYRPHLGGATLRRIARAIEAAHGIK